VRIEAFWVKGFRSLRDVRIEGLGPFNVFYGPNGAGKSNILAAMRVLVDMLRVSSPRVPGVVTHPHAPADPYWGQAIVDEKIVRRTDLSAHSDSATIVIGARFARGDGDTSLRRQWPDKYPELAIEVTLDWLLQGKPTARISLLESRGARVHDQSVAWNALFEEELARRAFRLIGVDRYPHAESRALPPEGLDAVFWHLGAGRVKNALLAAHVSPSGGMRQRLETLRGLLAGPPLHRPPFAPVHDPRTDSVDLHERLGDPNPEGLEVPINLAGLGIAQIYAILAQALLGGERVIGIEEPEAHLHAPTSGRALRQLLKRLVDEKHIDQLFIATHSNLFDLDPTGYFDVSVVDGCTVVERKDLTNVDHDHLYEPGPAKHALQRLLEYAPASEIVFRRGDGSPVSAGEMLTLLQEDDDIAVRFLQDVHGAAVRMVKVGAKKAAPH
jgi:hypothetical protein